MTYHGIHFDPEKLADFCRSHGVKRFSLFGSILRDDFRPDIDIDVLVEFSGPTPSLFDLGGMQVELSALLGREVDLKSPGFLSRHFRDEVMREAQPVNLKAPFDHRRAYEAEIRGWEAGLDISRAHCRQFHANRCVFSVSMLGEQDRLERPHRLVAIEGIDDPEMVQICEVGAHNEAFPGARGAQVYEAMVAVYQKQPFAVNFADPAGLKAYFLNPLSEAEAREFEGLVVDVSPEAYDFADEEGLELWDFMRRTGELILWWD